MKCSAYEPLIALFVEGDLGEADHARVETHIRGCAACRNLANELRESLGVFKDLRGDAVQMSALVALRQRVLNEVGDLDPAPGWVIGLHRLLFAGMRRRNAIAGIALAALITGGVWHSQKSVVREIKNEGSVAVARLDAPTELVSRVLIPPPPEVPRRMNRAVLPETRFESPLEVPEELPVAEPVPQQIQTSQVSTIKFVTDDPDIIIYWLPTDKGD